MIQRIDNTQSSYLRVVLNTNCNFNCYFCHHEGEEILNQELNPEVLYKTLHDNPLIKKVKITGGEPLLRKDLPEIIKHIKEITKAEVSLTTNGYYLKSKSLELHEAGLDRINVSLHSLDKQIFKEITGTDGLNKVLEGIDEASKYFPIKINNVVSKINFNEMPNFIDYCKKNKFILRPMYLLPVNNQLKEYIISLNDIIDFFRSNSSNESETDNLIIFDVNGSKVHIKKRLIFPKCEGCSHLDNCGEGIYAVRLSVNGNLKQCLYNHEGAY